jgi:hypothetical protein
MSAQKHTGLPHLYGSLWKVFHLTLLYVFKTLKGDPLNPLARVCREKWLSLFCHFRLKKFCYLKIALYDTQ